jgi:hypothetical protein
MITVVNVKSFKGVGEYVGRSNAYYGLTGSVLANPENLKSESDRIANIARYEIWLNGKMKSDTPQKREVLRLKALWKVTGSLTLICWCAPKPCHGEVIKRFIEGGAR